MFEAAELGRSLSRREYKAGLPELRARLLAAHLALRGREFPVLVLVSGADGAGKGELVQRLNEWLEPRGVETHAFGAPSEEESERPPYWRFWRAMPGRGRIGILFGSWYSGPIVGRVHGRIGNSEFEAALDRVAAFEQMLANDGAVLIKLWLHLPKAEQKQRLQKLETEGRLGPDDWRHYKLFRKFAAISERAIRHTDTATAPWHVIEATDSRYCQLTAGRILADALENAVQRPRSPAPPAAPPSPRERPARRRSSILDRVDLTRRLTREQYEEQRDRLQQRLAKLGWRRHRLKRAAVLVFEGWDAAGKGGAIRRVVQALDPRLYRVVGVAAPTEEERAQHYLWRFWRHLPRAGFITLFDRSWYGRVLVERVEGFASPAEWSRAYGEINAFEEQLTSHGIAVCKFWLHISREEQLRRFKERQKVAYKRHKITDEDWRNREKWEAYERAVHDMVARCSTAGAPWTLVAADDKRVARIQVLKTIVGRLGE